MDEIMSRRIHKQQSLIDRDDERLARRPPLTDAERMIFRSKADIVLLRHHHRRKSYNKPLRGKQIIEIITRRDDTRRPNQEA